MALQLITFTPIAFVDTWALASSLRSKLSLLDDVGIFLARRGDKWNGEVRKSWTPLWNVLARMRRMPAAADHELGSVWVEERKPHAEGAWAPGEDDGWIEARVALVTNPSAYVFCGIAAQHFPVGSLIAVNRGLPRCRVNWGDQSCYHLVVEFKKREVDDADHDQDDSAR